MADNKPDEVKAEEAKPKRGAKAEPELITLQHEHKGNWTLSIEGENYPVVDGAVEVPAFHVPNAQQAGFRPAV